MKFKTSWVFFNHLCFLLHLHASDVVRQLVIHLTPLPYPTHFPSALAFCSKMGTVPSTLIQFQFQVKFFNLNLKTATRQKVMGVDFDRSFPSTLIQFHLYLDTHILKCIVGSTFEGMKRDIYIWRSPRPWLASNPTNRRKAPDLPGGCGAKCHDFFFPSPYLLLFCLKKMTRF